MSNTSLPMGYRYPKIIEELGLYTTKMYFPFDEKSNGCTITKTFKTLKKNQNTK